jgi:uncharacterized HAD superfamily protein
MTLADMYSNDPAVWNAPDDMKAIERVDEYLKTKEYQQAEPFKEAIEAIRILSKHHDLHVVTGRADFLSKATEDMLTQYFPDIFQSVECTNFFTKSSRSKAQVCEELGADLLIDDHIHHAEVVAKCGIDVLLFGTYPWNAGEVSLPNIKRVASWREVVELLA